MSSALAGGGRLHSLQLRFMLTVIVGAALFAALAGAIAYRLGHERAYASSLSSLASLAQAVEKTVAVGAYAGDHVLLQEVVDGLARNELVAGVVVRTPAAKPLVARWNPGYGPGDSAGLDAARLAIVRTLASPFDAQDSVGTLQVYVNVARVGAAATRQAYTLAAVMIGQAALVAALLYALAARLVSRPIVRLARRLQAMDAGTDERLPTPPRHRHDEIGVLIGGANALLDANAAALRRERALRAEIEAMEAQYRQIFDSSSAGIFVIDNDGRLINGNPTVSRVVGLSLAEMRELQHDNFLRRVFSQPGQVQAMIEEARRRGATVSGDLELVRQEFGTRWVHCLVSVQGRPGATDPRDGNVVVEGVIYDITERKSAESAVRHLADHDALTGLKNRRASLAAIDGFVDVAINANSTVTLLSVDLDGFKEVNDVLGHQAGDQVLRACTRRMNAAMRRSSDLVGRLGGDEFVIALPNVGPADPVLLSVADSILKSLGEPIVLDDGRQAQIGVSIGIACLPCHGTDRRQLIDAADAALYEVKRHGKNGYAMALAPRALRELPVLAVPMRGDRALDGDALPGEVPGARRGWSRAGQPG